MWDMEWRNNAVLSTNGRIADKGYYESQSYLNKHLECIPNFFSADNWPKIWCWSSRSEWWWRCWRWKRLKQRGTIRSLKISRRIQWRGSWHRWWNWRYNQPSGRRRRPKKSRGFHQISWPLWCSSFCVLENRHYRSRSRYIRWWLSSCQSGKRYILWMGCRYNCCRGVERLSSDCCIWSTSSHVHSILEFQISHRYMTEVNTFITVMLKV